MADTSGPLDPDPVITCVDCGGHAYLLGEPPEMGWQPGDLATYRCRDCNDRWDLLVPERDDGAGDG